MTKKYGTQREFEIKIGVKKIQIGKIGIFSDHEKNSRVRLTK